MMSTLSPGYWPRAEVTLLRGGTLRCVLDYKRAYSLAEAYSEEPHVQFLNLRTDLDFIRFVKRYGPLSLVAKEGGGADPVTSVRDCRDFQKYLLTVVTLIKAFRGGRLKPQSLRDALVEYLSSSAAHIEPLGIRSFWKVVFDRRSTADATEFTLGGGQLLLPDEPRRWVQRADEKLLRWAAAAFIENSVAAKAGFRVDWKDRHPKVIAEWNLGSLRDALVWMCWYDVLRKNLIAFCAEAQCEKAFRPTNAHRRKFHSWECGHRRAARKSARKKRREQKRAKREQQISAKAM